MRALNEGVIAGAGLDVGPDLAAGIDRRMDAGVDVLADEGEGAYVAVLAYGGAGRDVGLRVDAALVELHLVILLQQVGKGQIGVGDTNHSRLDRMLGLEVVAHYHCGGIGVVYIVGILAVGQERETAGLSLFDFAQLPHLGIGIALYIYTEHCCYLTGIELHIGFCFV